MHHLETQQLSTIVSEKHRNSLGDFYAFVPVFFLSEKHGGLPQEFLPKIPIKYNKREDAFGMCLENSDFKM